MGHNEMLIAEALREVPRDRYLLSVKFGALRDPAGGWIGLDGQAAGDEELPRLFAAAARPRLHRHLSARSARPERPDRGHGGRDRRLW